MTKLNIKYIQTNSNNDKTVNSTKSKIESPKTVKSTVKSFDHTINAMIYLHEEKQTCDYGDTESEFLGNH